MRFFGLVAVMVMGGSLVGCGGNACEKAADDMAAKYEECGMTVTDGGEGEDVECTDELAAQMECISACTTGADCAALDGSDVDAATEYATCLVDCASTGGTTSS